MNQRTLAPSPLSILALVVVAGVAWAILGRASVPSEAGPLLPSECEGLTSSECEALLRGGPTDSSRPGDPILSADVACRNAGYLCAEVEQGGSLLLLRWANDTENLRILVPEPDGFGSEHRRELQRAAVRGIQAWQGHPFPLSIRTRSRGEDHDVRVEWRPALEGGRLGRAQIQWIREGTEIRIQVLGLHIATQHPQDREIELTPRQVELVAAHEMGHVLGLPHSDNPRDIMYPENTSSQLTARDFRTLSALYALPNGALIER